MAAGAGETGWRNAADSVDTRVAARADAAELVRLRFDDRHAMAYGLAGARRSAGRVHGGTATFRDTLPDVDVELISRAGGIKETLVLRSPKAPHTFVFPLRLTGLTASLVDGRVVLADAGGRLRAVIPAGTLVDAAGVAA